MKIVNDTTLQVATMLGDGPDGLPALTIIVKGSFSIRPGDAAALAEDPLPIAETDEFYDDDEIQSVRLESDMAPFKPRCDVVLVGRAYAPGGKPVTELDVSLQVGPVFKRIRVFGNRFWSFPRLALAPAMSEPQPFTVMDLVYDRAFGGIDHKGGKWCRENLIGKGFFAKKKWKSIHDTQLPNLEDLDDPENRIASWKSHPKPVGFGFYGREWLPRSAYLGTIDDDWAERRAPKMPEDFSFAFYNAAHPDLQAKNYLRGNESVELRNVTPGGRLLFYLSGLKPVVTVSKLIDPPPGVLDALLDRYPVAEMKEEGDEREEEIPDLERLPTEQIPVKMNLDTICLLPEENRFYQVWRGLYPLSDASLLAVEATSVALALGRVSEDAVREHPPRASQRQPRKDSVIELGLLESTQSSLSAATVAELIRHADEKRRTLREREAASAQENTKPLPPAPVNSSDSEALLPQDADEEPEVIDSGGGESAHARAADRVVVQPNSDSEPYESKRNNELSSEAVTTPQASEIAAVDNRAAEIFDDAQEEAAVELPPVASDVEAVFDPGDDQYLSEEEEIVAEEAQVEASGADDTLFGMTPLLFIGEEEQNNEVPAHDEALPEIVDEIEATQPIDASKPSPPPPTVERAATPMTSVPLNRTAESLSASPAPPRARVQRKLPPKAVEKQLEKIAAAYAQRLRLLGSSKGEWAVLNGVERRLQMLAKSLRATDGNGVRLLFATLEDRDAARLFAAAFALLSIAPERCFKAVTARAADERAEALTSLSDAVRLADIKNLDRIILARIHESNPRRQAFLLDVIGSRHIREPRAMEFIGKGLFGIKRDVTLAALGAQSKLRFPEFLPLIRRLALNDDYEIQDAALLNLLLAGKYEAFRVLRRLCTQATQRGSHRYLYLAFNGGKSDIELLTKHTRDPLALSALGILGFSQSVPMLIKHVNSRFKELCRASAEALHTITGAQFDDYNAGNGRHRRDCPCMSPQQWETWWAEHGNKFSPNVRWRRGKVFSPGRCIQQMADPTLSCKERHWAYLELVIRTGQDFPFEADGLISEQRTAIEQWKLWWNERGRLAEDEKTLE